MERFEEIFQRILQGSLRLGPEDMLREWLGFCMELSGATGGSILTEEGSRLEFAFSNVESLIGGTVPWDSIAGNTVRHCKAIYTFAPADKRHFEGVDRQISGQTRYLLSIPIVSVHMPNEPGAGARSHGALQLLFDQNILPDQDVSAKAVEFTLDSVREQACYEQRLKEIFWLLPNISFGMEILRLRQTSYQVIHELKNKFVGAQSWLGCLRDDIEESCPEILRSDAVAEDFELAESASREGAELAKSYLQFTKLYNPHFRETDLNRLVNACAANLRALVSDLKASITIETELDSAVGSRRLDPEQVKMALFNLGKNAVEVLAEQKSSDARIVLASLADSDAIRITVNDNGPGMPEKVAENLFKPFTTQKEGGTGLGLTITKKIVDTHGGLIRCETGVQGTRFVLEFGLRTESSCADTTVGPQPEE